MAWRPLEESPQAIGDLGRADGGWEHEIRAHLRRSVACLLRRSGDKNERDLLRGGLSANGRAEIEQIHVWHCTREHDEIRGPLAETRQRAGGVVGTHDVIADTLEGRLP